jgi:anti-sigma B factor antagonist
MASGEPILSREDRDGVPTLVLVGDFDLAAAEDLRAALRSLGTAGSATPQLDLSGVTFLDSSGLGVLLDFQRDTAASNGAVVVLAPSPPCRRLLEITGVDTLFDIRG